MYKVTTVGFMQKTCVLVYKSYKTLKASSITQIYQFFYVAFLWRDIWNTLIVILKFLMHHCLLLSHCYKVHLKNLLLLANFSFTKKSEHITWTQYFWSTASCAFLCSCYFKFSLHTRSSETIWTSFPIVADFTEH